MQIVDAACPKRQWHRGRVIEDHPKVVLPSSQFQHHAKFAKRSLMILPNHEIADMWIIRQHAGCSLSHLYCYAGVWVESTQTAQSRGCADKVTYMFTCKNDNGAWGILSGIAAD